MEPKNKQEYLESLSKLITDISHSDYEDAMRYIEEYFDEAGEEILKM